MKAILYAHGLGLFGTWSKVNLEHWPKNTWWCFVVVFRHRKNVTSKASQFQVSFQLLTSSAPRARHSWVHLMNSHAWDTFGRAAVKSETCPLNLLMLMLRHGFILTKVPRCEALAQEMWDNEHCFWWSPGFVNKRVSQVVKSELPGLAISTEHPLLYTHEDCGLTFGIQDVVAKMHQNAALVLNGHTTSEWISSHFSCGGLLFWDSAMPTFDDSSWRALEPAFNEHIQSYQTAIICRRRKWSRDVLLMFDDVFL